MTFESALPVFNFLIYFFKNMQLLVREAHDRRAERVLPRRLRVQLHLGGADEHLRAARQLQAGGLARDPGADPQVLPGEEKQHPLYDLGLGHASQQTF